MFKGDKQHDAQEALNTILDCLEEENKQKDENKISEIFNGEMKEVITCNKCASISKPIDLFRFLHVDVPKRKSTLDECIGNGMKDELMHDKPCLECKNSNEATKKTFIHKLPEVLIIHLKRFFFEGKWSQKIHTEIDSPMTLDMGKYTEEGKECRYQLYSYVNHTGGSSGGHYTATCQDPIDPKTWYCHNDETSEGLKENEIKTDDAYILFYKKERTTKETEERKSNSNESPKDLDDLDDYFDEAIPIVIENDLPNNEEIAPSDEEVITVEPAESILDTEESKSVDVTENALADERTDDQQKEEVEIGDFLRNTTDPEKLNCGGILEEAEKINATEIAPTEETMTNKVLVEDTILPEDTILDKVNNQEENNKNPPNKQDLNKEFCITEMKKAIEEKKDAEMNTRIEEMKKAEKIAVEMIKKEEENRYNALKKKFQALENKMKKKEEELEAQKNLTKLKQTKFLEDLENLTKEYAEKFKDMQTALLEKDDTISKLKNKDIVTEDISNILKDKKDTEKNRKVHTDGEKRRKENPAKEKKKEEENDTPNGDDEGDKMKIREGRKCFNCNIRGHIAKDCPSERNSKWCKICSKDNHNTEDCWSGNQNPRKQKDLKSKQKMDDNQGEACICCGTVGHSSKDCPNENSSKWCNICSKDNHNTEDCWSAKRHSRKQEGLKSKQTGNDNSGDAVCTVCKKKGHLAKDCRLRNKSQRGRNNNNGSRKVDDGKDTEDPNAKIGTQKEKCSTCGKKGHSTEDCWHGKDTNKADTRKTKMAAGSKNDQDLMSLLNMVKQWHQQRTQ